MAYIENIRADGVTVYGMDFFKRYEKSFGKVVRAEMTTPFGKPPRFTLENDLGEKMVFDNTFTSGYKGEGQKATQQVLELCGFPVDGEFAEKHKRFELKK